MTSKIWIDKHQGDLADGKSYGYVGGRVGGYFFTWMATLEDTLSSIEADDQPSLALTTAQRAVTAAWREENKAPRVGMDL